MRLMLALAFAYWLPASALAEESGMVAIHFGTVVEDFIRPDAAGKLAYLPRLPEISPDTVWRLVWPGGVIAEDRLVRVEAADPCTGAAFHYKIETQPFEAKVIGLALAGPVSSIPARKLAADDPRLRAIAAVVEALPDFKQSGAVAPLEIDDAFAVVLGPDDSEEILLTATAGPNAGEYMAKGDYAVALYARKPEADWDISILSQVRYRPGGIREPGASYSILGAVYFGEDEMPKVFIAEKLFTHIGFRVTEILGKELLAFGVKICG